VVDVVLAPVGNLAVPPSERFLCLLGSLRALATQRFGYFTLLGLDGIRRRERQGKPLERYLGRLGIEHPVLRMVRPDLGQALTLRGESDGLSGETIGVTPLLKVALYRSQCSLRCCHNARSCAAVG
jgi:hypothetical protein